MIINKNKLPEIKTRGNYSFLNRSNDSLYYQKDSLLQFYKEIKERGDLRMSKERKQENRKLKVLSQLQKRNEDELLSCKNQIRRLKDELKEEKIKKLKTETIHNVEEKLTRAYNDLKISELQKRIMQNQHTTLPPTIQYSPPPYNPYWNQPFDNPSNRYYERKKSVVKQEREEKTLFRRKPKKKALIHSFEEKKLRKKELKRKFKAAVWAVFFALKIPEYNKKIIKVRKQMLSNFRQKPFIGQMIPIQKWVVNKIRQFLSYMVKKEQVSLQPFESDTSTVKEQKVNQISRIIWILFKGLDSFNEEQEKEIIEVLHLFCKHGCFICSDLMTKEELALTTVSDIHGYLRLTKNMEKSQIISFLFIKVLVYNTIITPEKIDFEKFGDEKQILRQNMFLIGSIFYRICTDLQDGLIESIAQKNYPLNNWEKYASKFKIDPCPSLCVGNRELQEGELISGMESGKRIESIMGGLRKEKRKLKDLVEKYHRSICNYHRKILNRIKF